MNKVFFFIILSSFSATLAAANLVDVYGVNPDISEELLKKYGSQVRDIEAQFIKELTRISNGAKDQDLPDVLMSKRNQLINDIKKQYDFSFVHFDTVLYPGKNTYTTIEVVNKNESGRLQFIPKQKELVMSPKLKQDIVDQMMVFDEASMKLIINNQIKGSQAKCPVYHCLPGFNHPLLKNSFNALIQKAEKEKTLLIHTIEQDPSPQRKIAAIYLIGYLKNPQEIISLLNKLVMNSDDGVRNSAMRVIGETMNKAKIHDIDVMPFLQLLDSPFDTDRNKALLVLFNSANSPASKRLIIKEGNKSIISLLRLKQPNNHEATYELLKKISGKDFGAYNIDAWKKWLESA